MGDISDPEEYKKLVMEVLSDHPSEFCRDIHNLIVNNEINSKLDLKLRTIQTIQPFDMLVPLFREYLGLTIMNDEQCVKELLFLKSFVNNTDQNIIDGIVDFINGSELPENIVPETDLLLMMEEIPPEHFNKIYNCIEYIQEISEFPV